MAFITPKTGASTRDGEPNDVPPVDIGGTPKATKPFDILDTTYSGYDGVPLTVTMFKRWLSNNDANEEIIDNADSLFKLISGHGINPLFFMAIAKQESGLGQASGYRQDMANSHNWWGYQGAFGADNILDAADEILGDIERNYVPLLKGKKPGAEQISAFVGRWNPTDNPEGWFNGVTSALGDVGGSFSKPEKGKKPKEAVGAGGYTRTQANKLWLKKTGHKMTDDEWNMINNPTDPWDQDQILDFLDNKQYPGAPKGVTYGTYNQVKDAAVAAAMKWLQRAPDDSEIQFIMAHINEIPIQNIDAFYEQVKTKAVWAKDPASFRAMRRNIVQLFNDNGIQLNETDTTLPDGSSMADAVNRALNEKWTSSQLTHFVLSQHHPALPGTKPGDPGGTIADYNKLKKELEGLFKTFLPGKEVTDDDVKAVAGMTPGKMHDWVTDHPSEENPAIKAGDYYSAKTSAQHTLEQLGIVGREPSDKEIALFASGKWNIGAIEQYYRTLPELVSSQPGLPYHLNRDQYYKTAAEIERDYQAAFGGADLATGTEQTRENADAKATTPEPEWLSSILKQGIGPDEAHAMFQDSFKRLGRAPTVDETMRYRTRQTEKLNDRVVEPNAKNSPLGPTTPNLGGAAQDGNQFATRR